MNRQDAEEWTQALALSVAGTWKQVALAKRLGVPKLLGLTTEQWVNKHLGGYIKLHVNDRRKAVEELHADGFSTREIGEVLGIDNKTAWNDLHAVENSTQQDVKGPQTAATENGDVENSTPAPLDELASLTATDVLHAQEIVEKAEQRTERLQIQRIERFQRIEQISRGNSPLPTDRRYPVIYADPPWRYEHPPMGDGNRSIENHYPTLSLAEICALPGMQDIIADDAVLYLWATAPKHCECMEVIKAWGFDYRTNMVWVKDKIGMGYYARNQHETLLIARRGNLPTPAKSVRPSSVIHAPRGEHSVKPVEFYEIIERCYPELGKIELFCRSPRHGWAAWGNQVPEVVA